MDEDDIYDLGDDDDLGWFYVEEDFSLADELAESQIADPGYAGTNHDLAMEDFDFDLYNYWDDLEYGLDTYWDDRPVGSTGQTGQKRKHETSKKASHQDKRRKLTLEDTQGGMVIFVSLSERLKIFKQQPPLLQVQQPWALLPDWKERFVAENGVVNDVKMPREMRDAAEGDVDASPTVQRHIDVEAEEWEDDKDEDDEDDEEEGKEEAGGTAGGLSIDPVMLQELLRTKLGSANLDTAEEEAFMQAIAKMLSGDGDADQAAGELANSLLGQITDGNDDALSGWLSQQGVSLDAEEDDDDESSVATSDIPVAITPKNTWISPSDSAIDLSKSRSKGNIQLDSPARMAGKRSAPTTAESKGGNKRSKLSSAESAMTESTMSAEGSVPITASEDSVKKDAEHNSTNGSSAPTLQPTTKPTSQKRKAATGKDNEQAIENTAPSSKRRAASKTTVPSSAETRVTRTRAAKTKK